jgi:hypothetical protein
MHQHRTRKHALAILNTTLALLVCLAVLGCGPSSDIDKVVVTGRVTLDGQPIPNGELRFIPDAGTKGPISGGPIKDGVYKAAGRGGVPVGEQVVEIRAYRPQGGPQAAANEGGPAEQYLPPKYNDQTTLRATIDPSTETQDFELTSK